MKKEITMEKVKVAVDFKKLLEDITYTNKIMKTFDMSDIITKNQYYQLKDNIILWLVRYKSFLPKQGRVDIEIIENERD